MIAAWVSSFTSPTALWTAPFALSILPSACSMASPVIWIDTRNPTSKLLLTMLGAVATFERKIMLERQREGIVAAAAAGKYKGRAPTARAKADHVRQLASEGTTKEAIARIAGISVASVYRILADSKGRRDARKASVPRRDGGSAPPDARAVLDRVREKI